ncbi:MAG: hypothetical protein ABIQ40_03240 [Bacteroidia bacterium]
MKKSERKQTRKTQHKTKKHTDEEIEEAVFISFAASDEDFVTAFLEVNGLDANKPPPKTKPIKKGGTKNKKHGAAPLTKGAPTYPRR